MKIKLMLVLISFANLVLGQGQVSPDAQKSMLTNLCKSINENYVLPDRANAIAGFIQSNRTNGKYDSLSNPNDLARQLSKDIRTVSKDSHIRVIFDPELETDIVTFLSSKKNAGIISEADIAQDQVKNFHFRKIEILPSNIGYIELNGFAVPSKSTSNTILSAMQFVAHADAVILDLRNNFGGNAVVANEVMSYFFSDKQYTGRTYNRIEDKWTADYVDGRSKNKKGVVLKVPVYVLTSERTFSAAEGFAYNLQQLKNAVLVGDTTRGGAHLTRSFSLGNGFVAFIPFSRTENAVTKTDWEGTGVLPNIPTKEGNALVEAQLHFLNIKLLAQTNDEEKRKTNYAIHHLKSKTGVAPPPISLVNSFLGSYEYFTVSYEKEQLLFMDTKNFKEPVKMTPISNTMFQIGFDYQVEFKTNDKGEYDSIQMYWDDGWTEIIKKIK